MQSSPAHSALEQPTSPVPPDSATGDDQAQHGPKAIKELAVQLMRKYGTETPEQTQRRQEWEATEAERERARDTADRRRRLEALFAGSERYKLCTLDNFAAGTPDQARTITALRDYQRSLSLTPRATANLIISGPIGTGKDHLLAAMMRFAIEQHNANVIWRNGLDLYGEARDRMDDDRSEREFIGSLVTPQILAISDPLPPTGAVTPYQSSMLLRIIDGRYRRCLPTWITMNAANRSEAEQRMGAQNIDRLGHDALILFCNWPSYRKPLAP